VVVGVHTLGKANRTLQTFPRVETFALDLMRPASIDAFAGKFLDRDRALHMLIHSAGIMAPPLLCRDVRGYEAQFSTNHLGHFQLTARLLPALKRAGDARVVAVSSRAQRLGGVNFDDIHWQHTEYIPMRAYAQSKTANVLFAVELDRLAQTYGIRAFAAHPGLVPSTDLLSRYLPENTPEPPLPQPQSSHVGDTFKTPLQGAATPLWCALSRDLDDKGGVYCEDCNIAEAVTDSTSPFGVLPWAIDPEAARRLWTLSETLTGISFEF
jgi:NAD(P)-dependent dehydrogenase (short-subunit alcohol dehydrogenase family)